jgi:hypothetical protein
MLVVDRRATGMDILFRSMWMLGALVVLERVGSEGESETSEPFMRLVTALARDMTSD